MFYDFIGDQGPLRFISENLRTYWKVAELKEYRLFPLKSKIPSCSIMLFVETQINSRCDFDSEGDRIYGTFRIDFTSWNGEEFFLSERQRGNGLFFES